MFFWSTIPFVRITVLLILGILLGNSFPGFIKYVSTLSGVSFLLLIALFITKDRWLIRYNRVYGFLIAITFISAGYLLSSFHQPAQDLASDASYIKLMVKTTPEHRGAHWRLEGEVLAELNPDHRASGSTILLYLKGDIGNLAYGDVLLAPSEPLLIQGPRNPGEFDFKSYMRLKGITQQMFIPFHKVMLTGENIGNPVMKVSQKVRLKAEKTLEQFIPDKNTLAICKALLIGDKSDLSAEERQKFSETGVMHILAVSGLHVGIIYVIVLGLLRQRPNQVTKPILIAMVGLPVLWSYALLTGFSPSVLRAVTMFTFVIIGQAINRKSNIFNTVALSAFFLLLFDPFMLFSVGFQLSYLAVIGILLLYPIFSKWLQPQSWLGYQVWQIVCVSMAAQLATVPLSLYYFHQLPTYFLLGNIMAIPVATLLVWLGVMMIVIGPIWLTLGGFIGVLIQYISHGFSWLLELLQKLPYASFSDIYLDLSGVLLLYLAIISTIIWLSTRSKVYFLTAIGVILLFFGLELTSILGRQNESKIVFYSLRKHWAIDFVQGSRSRLLSKDSREPDEQVFQYTISPYRQQAGVKGEFDEMLETRNTVLGTLINFKDKTILIASETDQNKPIPDFIDFVFMINKQGYGGSGTVKWLDNMGQPIEHSLSIQGALEIEL